MLLRTDATHPLTVFDCYLRSLPSPTADVLTAPPAVQRLMDEIVTWFRTYKIPEGKGENSFAFDGKWLGAAQALEIIEATHGQWKKTIGARPVAMKSLPGETALKAPKAKGPWLPPAEWAPFVPAAQKSAA